MTKEDLKYANKLDAEIQKMSNLVGTLGLTIDEHEDPYNPRKNLRKLCLRFCNDRKKEGAPKEANILLFRGIEGAHCIDIPVDLEVIKILRDHFNQKLEDMQAEFRCIGQGPNA